MIKIGTKEQREKIKELIEEADKKGFKKGTFYVRKTLKADEVITQQEVADHRAELFHIYDDERGISLFCGPSQGLIYTKGEWIVSIDDDKSKLYW